MTPDSSSGATQLLRAYFRSKKDMGEVYELDSPFWDLSAETPGAHDLSRYRLKYKANASQRLLVDLDTLRNAAVLELVRVAAFAVQRAQLPRLPALAHFTLAEHEL